MKKNEKLVNGKSTQPLEAIMKTLTSYATTIATTLILVIGSGNLLAQMQYPDEHATFKERNLEGPRLGFTYIAPGGKLAQSLTNNGMKNLLSQFGWHFEYCVVPEGGGPSFVVEFVPLLAGVEYGKFIPSATLGLGIRLPDGLEFGLGPNLMLVGEGNNATALMMTIGKSFSYGGVNLPVNLVWVTNPDGNRFSLIFGYAIGKSSK